MPSSPDPSPEIGVSVLIPIKDEAENLTGVLDELAEVLRTEHFDVIVIDDGSEDGSFDLLTKLAAERPWLRAMRHAKSCGKSAALWTGLSAAQGALIVTLDGDGQNDPRFIPDMLSALRAGGDSMGLIAGQRLRRYDGWAKKWGSKVANRVRHLLLADGTRDTACGLKAMRREVYRSLPYFDTMHRFLPALTLREGYQVGHVDVVDRARRHGVSKYGIWDRLAVGIPDLFGVWWLRRRRKNKPHIIDELTTTTENADD